MAGLQGGQEIFGQRCILGKRMEEVCHTTMLSLELRMRKELYEAEDV